jgi:hypothetical protein
MKIEIDGKEIRIKGEIAGNTRHLKIYCYVLNGMDYYSISLVKDGFEYGNLPSLSINKEVVMCRNNSLEKGEQLL